MNRKFVSGLVLGAGASSRFGQPKQLLPFRGGALLGWVINQAERAKGLDEVIVVLGRAATARLRSLLIEAVRVTRCCSQGRCSTSLSGCTATRRRGSWSTRIPAWSERFPSTAPSPKTSTQWKTSGESPITTRGIRERRSTKYPGTATKASLCLRRRGRHVVVPGDGARKTFAD